MKKVFSAIAAAVMLLSLCSCSEQSSSSSQATTAEPTTAAASTPGEIDATGDSAGDERIYGKWSGPQVTTQGDKLADVEMEFKRNGSFDYKAKGSYEKDDVEVIQDGTFTIDVDVVSMTFKNSTVKNLKTGKEQKEKISSDDYSDVSGTLTSATELYIVSDYGYTIELKKQK